MQSRKEEYSEKRDQPEGESSCLSELSGHIGIRNGLRLTNRLACAGHSFAALVGMIVRPGLECLQARPKFRSERCPHRLVLRFEILDERDRDDILHFVIPVRQMSLQRVERRREAPLAASQHTVAGLRARNLSTILRHRVGFGLLRYVL